MFDLEQAIADWRSQMLAGGINPSTSLEELETHLREDIQQQMKSGLGAPQAFATAAGRIGRPDLLNHEFQKVESPSAKKWGIFALLVGAVIICRALVRHHEFGPAWKFDQLGWFLLSSIIIFFGVASAGFNFTLGATRESRLWKLVGITYSLVALWVSIWPMLPFLFNMPNFRAVFSLTDRLLAFTAIGVSLLSIPLWHNRRNFLPVIRNRRIRTMIGVACCLFGPASLALFFAFILPPLLGRGNFTVPLLVVSFAWAWAMMAILGGVGYGLSEAARRQMTTVHT